MIDDPLQNSFDIDDDGFINRRIVADVPYDPDPQNIDGRTVGRKTVGADKITSIDANSVTTAMIQNLAVTTGKIATANITLALLASGITPSHIVKYAGTVTWSGSGATLTSSVPGVLSGDFVMATIRVKPTQAAYLVRAVPGTDQITFELSAANTSNDAQISYSVLRSAS